MTPITFAELRPCLGDQPQELLAKISGSLLKRAETLLSIGARTATTNTPEFLTWNARGLILLLNVSAASGTGGLQPVLYNRDSSGGNTYQVNSTPTVVTTTGWRTYFFHPVYPATLNQAATVIQNVSCLLSPWCLVQILHGDASSYTYSLLGILVA